MRQLCSPRHTQRHAINRHQDAAACMLSQTVQPTLSQAPFSCTNTDTQFQERSPMCLNTSSVCALQISQAAFDKEAKST